MLNRLLLFIAATCMGSLLTKMHLPIPYMLGGIGTALLCKAFAGSFEVSWPEKFRSMGLMVAGYGIGCSFNTAALGVFFSEFAGVVEANAIAIAISIILAWLIARYTKVNLQSCVMGMMPGGITLMMLLAEDYKKVNPNAVIVMQVIRLLGVVISVPFLVITLLDAKVTGSSVFLPANDGVHWLVFLPLAILGNFIGKKIHLPTPMILGTIIATAAFSVGAGQLQPIPGWLMASAQVSIGLYMGMLLDSRKLAQTKDIVWLTVLSTIILIGVSIAVALMLSERYGFSLVTAFLAMAPGGIAEMTLAGLSMGEDVAIILCYQMVRILAINLFVPPLLEWYFKEK